MSTGGTATRIGVLGGTFDPVHRGHLAVARFVLEQQQLDEFIFIPAARPPHKSHTRLAAFPDRLAMLQLALAPSPVFKVSDLEAARQGPSYSIDTLEELRRIYGPGVRLFFVIGLDAFLEVETWKDFARLPRLADLVVIKRATYPVDPVGAVVAKMGGYHYDAANSCWSAAELPGRIFLLSMPPVEISSTLVRRLAADGESLEPLLVPAVAAYIAEHHLYHHRSGAA
ncbi:MAG: nicotinate (nicotinamide) nucleotide adenylyltransferase [Desulfobulbaceae bacterium]|nr:nicotinate (nicotinamide) nucleotide adenylyltransferase [Desulfobulbaceae bacterium]